MTRTPFLTLALVAAGVAGSAGSASAQYVPGFVIAPRPVVGTFTTVTPYGGVRTATESFDPVWGTRTFYRGFANPFTGATYERQVVASPFGSYQTVNAYDPYYGVPYYVPYGTGYLNQTVRPAFYGNPQMAAYYNGIAWNRMRR
jgi:hypothetical protein